MMLARQALQPVIGWLDGQLETSEDELVEDVANFWVAAGNSAIDLTKKRLNMEAEYNQDH